MCKLIKNVYFCNSLITVLIKIMINRVLIRLKIIQIVYAYYQNGSKNLDSAEKELFFSLSKAYDLYNYLLMLMIALTDYAQKRIDTAKAKLKPTKEELYPNTKFVENKFIAQLEVNKQLTEFVANQKRTWANDQDFVKELYDKIVESDIYKEYMASTDNSYEADRELWRKLYKMFVFNNDSLDQVLEDQSLYWNDDKEIVDTFVLKTIKRFEEKQGANQPLLPEFKDDEDQEFARRCDQGRHSECMYRGADRSGVNAASDRHSKAAGDRPDPSKWFPDLCQINIRSAAPLSVCILFSCIHAKQCLRIF